MKDSNLKSCTLMCHLTMGIGSALWNASLGAFATVQTSRAHTQTKAANEPTEQQNLWDHRCIYSLYGTWMQWHSERSKLQETVKDLCELKIWRGKREASNWGNCNNGWPQTFFQKLIVVQHKEYTNMNYKFFFDNNISTFIH